MSSIDDSKQSPSFKGCTIIINSKKEGGINLLWIALLVFAVIGSIAILIFCFKLLQTEILRRCLIIIFVCAISSSVIIWMLQIIKSQIEEKQIVAEYELVEADCVETNNYTLIVYRDEVKFSYYDESISQEKITEIQIRTYDISIQFQDTQPKVVEYRNYSESNILYDILTLGTYNNNKSRYDIFVPNGTTVNIWEE